MADKKEGLPPPGKGARKGPEMAEEDPSIYGKLDKLAGQGGMGEEMGGGGGGEEQSAQLLMSGAQQLMQAAQMNPRLAPFIQQAMQLIQQGVQRLAGGGGMGGETGEQPPTKGKGRKRMRPPGAEEAPPEENFSY